ncbi:MAG: hypothetical protein JJE39_02050 [Vicinamibacteria bacterium]|nr:hypothetical protein [Vicinamibacteria bacterium]
MNAPALRFRSTLVALGASLSVCLSSPASAQTATPSEAWKRHVENTFAFVLNPLGIQDAFDISWTRSLSDRDDLLHKDAHLAAGVSSKLSPAFERIGGWLEYSPLSVIDLRVGVEPVYYFGTYKVFLPFDRAAARFDDDVIESRVDEAASGFAGRLYLSPTLKAKAGPVAARVRAEIAFWKAQKKGEPFYYEPALDTLIKASGSRVLTLEALALREFRLSSGTTLRVGPVYDLTTVSDARVNRKQDVGLLAVWSKSGAFHAFTDPTIAAKLIYFLEDPWRRHEAAAQIAFIFGL